MDLKWTYLVIVAALVALSRIDGQVMDPWNAGPGKQSTHHSGLVVYAHATLKIMKPCDQEPQCNKRNVESHGSQCLVLGKKLRAFLIQPYSTELEQKLNGGQGLRTGTPQGRASSIVGGVESGIFRYDISCSEGTMDSS